MANVLTAMMQEAERIKRNLKAAPGQIQDQLVNFVADWQGTKLDTAVKGKQPSAEQLQSVIQEVAGNALPGGGAAAGMFIGSGAKGGIFKREAIIPAYKAVKEGMDADTLWKKLGVYFGPDGRTRQEISDAGARLKTAVSMQDGVRPKVSDYLDHPEFAKAYPDIMEYSAFPTLTKTSGLRGSFDATRQQIQFPVLEDPGSLSTLLHELQHAVQTKEGFARGGNPGMFPAADKLAHRLTLVEEGIKDIAAVKTGQATKRLVWTAPNEYVDVTKNTKPEELQELFKLLATQRKELKAQVGIDSFEMYKRLLGEAEARSTQARQTLTAEQRREFGPSWFYDRPSDKLIIKK